ncbi:MAG: TonB family protein [Myxococcota bacterium]|nr:TonB family protein [Myxococcota bacterium]
MVLIVDVDSHGAVSDVAVKKSHGHGFDEAAVAAARNLRFDPAWRGGRPVTSKIALSYVFTLPPSRLLGRVTTQADRPIAEALITAVDSKGATHSTTTAEDGSWALANLPPGPVHLSIVASGNASAETDESLAPGEETTALYRLAPEVATKDRAEEITVRGQRPRREVIKRTLSKDEIERSSGTNGDALQSLQNLPGVARPPPLSGLLIVRGSAPQDTGIYVDGTNIPIAYHFGGLSSVVPTELLQKLDFYPGNFSAQYGRGMWGIVKIGLRYPRYDRLHGLAQVDAIDVRLLAELPVLNSGWSFLVAGRRSNPLLDALTAAPRRGSDGAAIL